jgi:hypothetical protein
MRIASVSDPSFAPYGKKIDLDTSEIVDYLHKQAKMPQKGNIYVRDDENMALLRGISEIKESIYGLGDIEVGYCNGFNSLLNCMEYHSCPEVDIAGDDLILLLAKQDDIAGGYLESEDVKAFLLKKGEVVVLDPYTLHFSPCKLSEDGFRCAIILTQGTNADLPSSPSDKRLWKVNKWLLAHPESAQAKQGAYIGIKGKNIEVEF